MPSPEIMIEPRPAPGRRASERRPQPPPPPAEPAPVVAAKKPRRWLRRIGWLFLFVGLWGRWALDALYDLSAALDNEDAVGVEHRLHWGAVPQGLRDHLRGLLRPTPLGEMA